MRSHKVLSVFLALLMPAVIAAQGAADVTAREQQRSEAVRSGQNIARFYAPAYRGIDARGQYETIEQIRALTARPGYARMKDFTIDVHDDTAIVTSIEGQSDAELELALRIWTKTNGAWTIAAAQTTWIGNRAGVPAPAGALPNTPVEAFEPRSIQESSLWFSQDTLMRAFADADPASYTTFSTAKSLRMTTGGDPIPRDQWLATIARRQKGPLAVVDEVRLSFFGDVAVVNLRGHEANPTRQSWVYLREGGLWKLHLRFTTLIRN